MKNNKKKKNEIIIRGAKVNNLRNINVNIPRNKLVIITGVSGSGKSSLAFDTIYAEGNRRYMEGLSAYARNLLDINSKPDIDKIENLSPTISIDQKSTARTLRSTVGTLTEIYDYLRLLYAKVGKIHCPNCGEKMSKKSKQEILEEIRKLPQNTSLIILAPHNYNKKIKKDNKKILKKIQQMGYARVRINNKIMLTADALLVVNKKDKILIETVVDRITLNQKDFDKERLLDSIETALRLSGGLVKLWINKKKEKNYNQDYFCSHCQIKIKEITPRHFSFNNPEGACSYCQGLGIVKKIDPELIIPNKNLSLREGAIRPWHNISFNKGSALSYGLEDELKKIAMRYKFSLDDPIKKMTAKQLKILLYGEKQKNSKIDLGGVKKEDFFEGIVTKLEERYHKTKSEHWKEEIEKYMVSKTCPVCQGKRLKKEYLSVLVNDKSINDLVEMSITDLNEYFQKFSLKNYSQLEKQIISDVIQEIKARLQVLEQVGLGYLSLNRSAPTISGGEAQRIRLSVQIKSQLMGIIYILDEPSIGLHTRDTKKLIKTMQALRDEGNTVIVVEHDRDIIQAGEWVIDMGPGAGELGGEIIFQGDKYQMLKSNTTTSLYLKKKKKFDFKKKTRSGNKKYLEIKGAQENNLKNIDVKIPLGKFVCVTGVSGSGKSTLVNNILARALSRHFYRSKNLPGKHKNIKGLQYIKKVINIDQSPIGRTPRSNVATYTGVLTHIRELFAETSEAKERNYKASRFSFNMKGGRCEVCQGEGKRKIEMQLLSDIYVPCEACEGKRYNAKTLEIEYKGVNIAQVLDMSVSYAAEFFKKHSLIYEKLKTMEQVGLGYLRLGQSAIDLSGGEAQRIKLATELARKSNGNTLYILDEPTIGLHFEDVKKLLNVLNSLVDKGNTVLVVEHNLDVVKESDWVIELGPDGGDKGGEIIFSGEPIDLKKKSQSWTGKYL